MALTLHQQEVSSVTGHRSYRRYGHMADGKGNTRDHPSCETKLEAKSLKYVRLSLASEGEFFGVMGCPQFSRTAIDNSETCYAQSHDSCSQRDSEPDWPIFAAGVVESWRPYAKSSQVRVQSTSQRSHQHLDIIHTPRLLDRKDGATCPLPTRDLRETDDFP